VIGGDGGAGREFIADVGGGEMLHGAADMHPWAQYDVVPQYPVADMQDGAGMDKVLPGVERLSLTHGPQIFVGVLVGNAERVDREPGANGERRLAGRRALGGRDRSFGQGGRWCIACPRPPSPAGDAELAMALAPQVPRRP